MEWIENCKSMWFVAFCFIFLFHPKTEGDANFCTEVIIVTKAYMDR